jgi:hypothetical protein
MKVINQDRFNAQHSKNVCILVALMAVAANHLSLAPPGQPNTKLFGSVVTSTLEAQRLAQT